MCDSIKYYATSRWKPVPDYPRYQINQAGEVVNILTGREISQFQNDKGYKKITLRNGKGEKKFFVHRLVMLSHEPIEDSNEYDVHHLDNTRDNNNLNNLMWCRHDLNCKLKMMG